MLRRSGGQCEMEGRWGDRWIRRFMLGVDPSHIYKRRDCGKARDLAEVIVHSCRPCHERYEAPPFGDKPRLRVPPGMREDASVAIAALAKARR